nr:MAG TPA: hypothetical protein [Caudoviricetes sp.]
MAQLIDTIDGKALYAARSVADGDGNVIADTYQKKGDTPSTPSRIFVTSNVTPYSCNGKNIDTMSGASNGNTGMQKFTYKGIDYVVFFEYFNLMQTCVAVNLVSGQVYSRPCKWYAPGAQFEYTPQFLHGGKLAFIQGGSKVYVSKDDMFGYLLGQNELTSLPAEFDELATSTYYYLQPDPTVQSAFWIQTTSNSQIRYYTGSAFHDATSSPNITKTVLASMVKDDKIYVVNYVSTSKLTLTTLTLDEYRNVASSTIDDISSPTIPSTYYRSVLAPLASFSNCCGWSDGTYIYVVLATGTFETMRYALIAKVDPIAKTAVIHDGPFASSALWYKA